MRWHIINRVTPALLSLVTLPMHAQLRATQHFAVPQSAVAMAIATAFSRQDDVSATPQITLLSNVVASMPSPQLDVTFASPLPKKRSNDDDELQIAIRLACHVHGACMPFYAIATWPAGKLPAQLAKQAQMSAKPLESASLKASVIMRLGTHATLILEDGSSHLQVPVISLQNGSAGQSIRVTSLDHKHVFTAHALTASLLKGSF